MNSKITEFKEGKVIDSTQNYSVVYGYKKGLEGASRGERLFLVPRSKKAEEVLVRFAASNDNTLDTVHVDWLSGRVIRAIRFNGPADALLDFLNSEGKPATGFDAGVPPLRRLDRVIAGGDW